MISIAVDLDLAQRISFEAVGGKPLVVRVCHCEYVSVGIEGSDECGELLANSQ